MSGGVDDDGDAEVVEVVEIAGGDGVDVVGTAVPVAEVVVLPRVVVVRVLVEPLPPR